MIFPNAPDLFLIKKGQTHLNHGGYGLTPKEVEAARNEWKDKVESAPGPFYDYEYPARWKSISESVAGRFHAKSGALALTANATAGMSSILRSMDFKPGDEVLFTSIGYGGIKAAVDRLSYRIGIKVVQADIKFPDPDPEQCVRAVGSAITSRTKLAIFDHVTSSTAFVLPVAAMTKACHERGVLVALDGAHAPGNIPLDIGSLGADWYTGNLHKWYFVPRGCGFLWAAPGRQENLDPPIMSWDSQKTFPNNFEWTGTHDPTTWLSIPAAFAFMDTFGEDKVRAHNHRLVREAAENLAKRWKSRFSAPENMSASMALVALPDDLPFARSKEGRAELQKALLDHFGIIAGIPSHSATPQNWVRLSAQIYSSEKDYENLDRAVQALRSGKALPGVAVV